MKQSKLALTAVMVVAIGLTGANLVGSSLESTEYISTAEFGTNLPFYGHVTAIHFDPAGNILAYIQTDNIVTHEGKDCAVETLFAGTGGIQGCPGGATDNFDRIGLTNGQTFKVTANATTLSGVDLSANGLAPAHGVVSSNTNATGASGSIVDIVNTFTSTADAQSVDGAILYNTAETVAFAAKEFTAVTLNTSDTLAVTWSITLG